MRQVIRRLYYTPGVLGSKRGHAEKPAVPRFILRSQLSDYDPALTVARKNRMQGIEKHLLRSMPEKQKLFIYNFANILRKYLSQIFFEKINK